MDAAGRISTQMDPKKIITTGYMAKKGSGFPFHIQGDFIY